MTELRVIEIFDSLQGEGYWTGTPMTFVRLAGCNAPQVGLACTRWCDTPGSWDADAAEAEELTPAAILELVHLPRLCLTGGEPLLQLGGVAELVEEAQRCGIRVHLETNGTVAPPVNADGTTPFAWVVVSPKPPAFPIAGEWSGLVDELKLVADDHLGTATAERLAAAHPEAIVSIQPLTRAAVGPVGVAGLRGAAGPGGAEPGRSGEETSEARAVRLVMDHPEWRLSLQTHKFLGIR